MNEDEADKDVEVGSVSATSVARNRFSSIRTKITNASKFDLSIGTTMSWKECLTCTLAAGLVEHTTDHYTSFRFVQLKAGETTVIDDPIDAERIFRTHLNHLDQVNYQVMAEMSYYIPEHDQSNCPTVTQNPDAVGEVVLLVFQIRPSDLGDAPDSTNHFGVNMAAYNFGVNPVQATFPTVFDAATGLPEGPIHMHPRPFHLGRCVSLEGEADVSPDQDPNNTIEPPANIANLNRADDGTVINQWNFSYCQTTTVSVQVFISNQAWNWFNTNDRKAFLNGWTGSNRNGS